MKALNFERLWIIPPNTSLAFGIVFALVLTFADILTPAGMTSAAFYFLEHLQ